MAHWLTPTEAARHLRIGVRTFRKRVKSGELPKGHRASDRRLLWTAEELDAVLMGAEHGQEHSDPIMAAINAANAKAATLRRENSR